eukprot:10780.XXX_383564_383683_1 [CDS] Oithona nana genome sequencing.
MESFVTVINVITTGFGVSPDQAHFYNSFSPSVCCLLLRS